MEKALFFKLENGKSLKFGCKMGKSVKWKPGSWYLEKWKIVKKKLAVKWENWGLL